MTILATGLDSLNVIEYTVVTMIKLIVAQCINTDGSCDYSHNYHHLLGDKNDSKC